EFILEDTSQYCYLENFDPTQKAYWVETYFVYAKDGEECSYRSYFNNSPYSIAEMEFEKYDFILFPNPVDEGNLYLQFPEKIQKIEGLRVFNIQGQKVLETKTLAIPVSIDISSLKPGVYTCTVELSKRLFITKKFIVN
ncbi:MAG: T9SS type A sorting domain-containing protein, partial [Bacteroidota bacterium]|nr:T9SS type A sorting domain-containing protein [Bacteroidota bacterium]